MPAHPTDKTARDLGMDDLLHEQPQHRRGSDAQSVERPHHPGPAVPIILEPFLPLLFGPAASIGVAGEARPLAVGKLGEVR